MKMKLAFKCIVILLCIFSILSYVTRPSDHALSAVHPQNLKEHYDPSFYYRFQSINDMIAEADECFSPSERQTLLYFEYINSIIEKRFYHGFSYYTLADNPLIFLGGSFIWSHLSAIVIPDDIMKHPMAACSQQSIVLMEVFRRKGIDFRKVGFDHHFALEGKINGRWYFFDPNREPLFASNRQSLKELLAGKDFYSIYKNPNMGVTESKFTLSNPYYGKINAPAAPRVALLHQFGFFLTSPYVLYLAVLLLLGTSLQLSEFRGAAFLLSLKNVYPTLNIQKSKWQKYP